MAKKAIFHILKKTPLIMGLLITGFTCNVLAGRSTFVDMFDMQNQSNCTTAQGVIILSKTPDQKEGLKKIPYKLKPGQIKIFHKSSSLFVSEVTGTCINQFIKNPMPFKTYKYQAGRRSILDPSSFSILGWVYGDDRILEPLKIIADD